MNIPRVMTFQVKIVQASCGFEHSVFRTLSGEIYAMGNNNFGQLGLGSGVRILQIYQEFKEFREK